LVLDARTGGSARYDITDFKVAMSVRYAVGAVGLAGILRTRRRLAPDGVVIRPIRETLAERRGLALTGSAKAEIPGEAEWKA
jgi:hypothetical protein